MSGGDGTTGAAVPRERVIRFEIGSRESLERLANGPPPDGLHATEPERSFHRDVYFDTLGEDLEDRGVVARVRHLENGARRLDVEVRERRDGGEIVVRRAQAEISGGPEGAEIFAGDSEAAKLLRSIVDPERLGARLELETARWERRFSMSGAPSGVTVCCDLVTVRHEHLWSDLEEVQARLPEHQLPGATGLIERLRSEYGLSVALAGKLARAREALETLEVEALEDRIRAAREVAVVLTDGARVALRHDDEGRLTIPLGPGWGEPACRRVVREVVGRGPGSVRRLGESAGIGTRPAVEVWLVEHAAEDADDLAWLSVDELLARVGSPDLRDAATLTALDLAIRRGVGGASGGGRGRTAERAAIESPFRVGRKKSSPPRTRRKAEAKALDPPPDLLLNMEASELAFNERVLALAEDPETPLLERVRFVSIVGSNLDEFFMTRVAGFHQQVASGSRKLTLDGLTPEAQLELIGIRARRLYDRVYHFLWNRLVPDLATNEIELLLWEELDADERDYLLQNYAPALGAVLTPLAADPSHPFPHIRNLRPHLAVTVRVPETEAEHFAAIELPGDLPRFVPLPGGRRFIALERLITAFLPTLYGGLEVLGAHVFRVTRSANVTLEDDAGDVLHAVEEKVRQRPLGPVVRLEVEQAMPEEMRAMLLRELQLEVRERVATLREADVYLVDRLVDLFALGEIASLPLRDLHYPPLRRTTPLARDRAVWPALREREILVRFPRHSFEATVERFLAEAARDPDVVSIRATLYRTDRASRVVKLLRRARRRGKDVVALVELKASFDEKRNIEWARSLESAGIHVVFGPPELKVHAKLALVVRREEGGLRRYAYVGTGNLNAATAAGYTDLGLFTSDPGLAEEVQEIFNGLTGYSLATEYEHLLVAPFNMRARFLAMIDREIEHARAGRGGHIRAKINGLTDREIISALYRASGAGVRIELIVRGLCSLRPGLPEVSENVTVVSILGRFLEHARIYRFENAGDPDHLIGSADWRPRNLSRRVEVVAPVRDPRHRQILEGILESNLTNPRRWELQSDGSYRRALEGVPRDS